MKFDAKIHAFKQGSGSASATSRSQIRAFKPLFRVWTIQLDAKVYDLIWKNYTVLRYQTGCLYSEQGSGGAAPRSQSSLIIVQTLGNEI